jgi:hypothetical protein
LFAGPNNFICDCGFEEVDMSSALQFSASIPVSKVSFAKPTPSEADSESFIVVALFSGIGLLLTLDAILSGVPGVWF